MNTKICSTCKKEKNLSEFYKYKRNKDGYRGTCIECHLRSGRERYKKNPEPVKIRSMEWNRANPELIKESQKKYRKSHWDYVKKVKNIWRMNNSEKDKAIARRYRRKHAKELYENNRKYVIENKNKVESKRKEWFLKNPFKKWEYGEKRRFFEKKGSGISDKEWILLKEKYGNICLSCKRSDVALTLDHIIPLCKGGEHSIENAQPLCRSCNSRKGTKIIDYRQELIGQNFHEDT